MKHLFATFLISCLFFIGCKKDIITIPTADFSFRGDTSSVFKMATYDTCTLINNSANSDSSYWDLGNGNISRDRNLVLTYANSGTYNIKLTVKNKDGQETSTTKKVIILDRVLKKIIIEKVYWDTIPNNIPNFNSVWPTSATADVFVQVQKFSWNDSIVPYSGLMPNSPILYQSPIIHNVSNNTDKSFEIDVPNKLIVDKKMVLDRTFAVSLMATDSNNIIYSLQNSLESGCSFGIQKEDFTNNQFVVVCNLFCSVKFYCDYE